MGIKQHTHRYIKVWGKHTHIWKCSDPDCNHFVYGAQDYIIDGRSSICWGCSEKFILDEQAMKDEQPRCFTCRNPKEFIEEITLDPLDAYISKKKL